MRAGPGRARAEFFNRAGPVRAGPNFITILYSLSLNNIFAQIRKYIQVCGGPLAKYEHFLKVIFIYKLIIQYILWIRHSGVYKDYYKLCRKYVEECEDIT